VALESIRGDHPASRGYDLFMSYSHHADAELAPALQAGLHRFAKPWYRLRALRVFRDDASLPASPALWPSIEEGLQSSRWFVLLASPEAAASEWVAREVQWWLDNRGPDQFLIVLTGGEFESDPKTLRPDPQRTTALPPTAFSRLLAEPRYIDLRWAQNDGNLSLANVRFKNAVADLASAVEGRPKDELIGEDVQQHRRTVNIVRATIATLSVLLIAAILAAIFAMRQRQTAIQQRHEAEQQRAVAIEQRNRAEEQARVALSRQLASEALTIGSSGADLALLLGVEAYRVKDTPQARSSIFRLLAENKNLGGSLGPAARGAGSLAFSPDAKLLAVGLPDAVAIWDVHARRELKRLPIKGTAPYTVAFSRNGLVAAGNKEGTVALWSLADGKELAQEQLGQFVMAVDFDNDGSRMVAGNITGDLIIVSVKDKRVLRLKGDQGPTIALSLDGHTLIAGGGQGEISTWDLRSAEKPQTRNVGAGQPLASAFDRRFTMFSGYSNGNNVPYIDDATTGNMLHDRELAGQAGAIDYLAFSDDGMLLAAAMAEGSVALWETETGQRKPHDLHGHPGAVQALTFSPDRSLLAVGGAGGVTIFDLGGQLLAHTITAHGAVSLDEVPNVIKAGSSVAFSPDGSRLAWPVGVSQREVVLWDLSANRELARYQGDGVYAFSDDGRELGIEVFDSRTAIVVNTDTGASRKEPAAQWSARRKGTIDRPDKFPWSTDTGQGLGASIQFDGTLTLWDTNRSSPLGTISIPDGFDYSFLVFNRTGGRLAVAGPGGALTLVDVDLSSWIERACTLAGRELDATEWRHYVGEDRPQTPVCTLSSSS